MQKQKKMSKYNGFQTKNKNYIWTGAMCLAWEELANNLIKEPIKLKTKNGVAQSIIKNFNQSKFKKNDISSQSIYIKSGFGQQTLKTINTQVKKKFKEKTMPDVKIKMYPNDFISFAYLFKKLEFSQIFQRNKTKDFKFNDIGVESFYAGNKAQKKTIFYYYYEDQNNFCIGLKTRNPEDLIYLIKKQKQLLIDDAIKEAIYLQKKGGYRFLQDVDKFQMPVIDIDFSRDIKQIMDLYFDNKNWKQYKLIKAFQALKLKIDQKGAIVQNKTYLYGGKGCCLKKVIIKPKLFLLNKDFWIINEGEVKTPLFMCQNQKLY